MQLAKLHIQWQAFVLAVLNLLFLLLEIEMKLVSGFR
jgi:hypothetical protein